MNTTKKKVCAHKLSKAMQECVALANDIKLFGASALDRYLSIANHILSGAVRQVDVVNETGLPKSDVSMAVTIANAVRESDGGDDEFVTDEFTSLREAYNAARAYLKTGSVPSKSARKPKASAKKAPKMTANDIVKTLGKAQAKKLAMDILARI